jgi:PAS domain S-box-containing protein
MELSKYILEVLWKDNEFNLYRGRSGDNTTQILVLSPLVEHPAPETLQRLEHEYSLRGELDAAWAVRPIAFSRHWDRTVLVLEDPGGLPLDQLLAHPLDLAFSLRLAVGLSSAIGRLHQRGIIHKDIKPAHVLVNSVASRCWLKGFGIASRLPRERQSAEPPELVAGTLAYMAPEQTGRMNRSTDSRSDLYAFGVSLYEMLTGSLPFTASDPMEWVHCHIARKPVPPAERSSRVPAAISAVVIKLLAKTAEERYQTAAGVESDLRRCLAEWEKQGRVDEFPLGEHDIPNQLLVPEKLYGRALEIDTLLASFDRVVATGRPELVLVSGYPGIGKSSVVNELHKVLVSPRGLFASGKFDQYKRDIPYATLAQAFQSLIHPLLGKSEAELRNWREALEEALGPNGPLMVNLVPELKLIIGEQPPVPNLPPQDAQARFQLVFRRFISVFARQQHPLALFLDDLQWLDLATLNLLEDLLRQPDVQHLMLIGAYRDNEVDSSHPLMRKLEAIRQSGAIVREIILAPLTCEDLERLIADSLYCESLGVTALAQLVHQKTGGNPFFANQFISALAEEALLTFDHSHGRWSWDLNRIQAKGYTDNVVELMVGKLNRLPARTQKTLKEFACLGNIAQTTMLSIVHGTSEEEVHSDLWEALRLEFIVRLDDSYKFVHDRIQEAAYSLIPEAVRAEAHLRVGRLLTACTTPERHEETIFEVVNQLNQGAVLMTARDEREQLAEFNLIAGKRAKASAAYVSAFKYLTAGAELLTDDCWERRYQLSFALELHRAECEFLTGELAAAEQRLTRLSARAVNTVEQATVACLLVDLYTTVDQSDRAVDVCLEYLRPLGIDWSPHPTAEEARREYERTWLQLGSRSIEELIDLPLMTDPTSLATLDVLTKVFPPASHTDANLLSLVICRAVNLSLEGGNTDASCVAYVWLAKIAGPYFDNYKAGFRFGRLGYELVEQRDLKRWQARTYLWFGEFVLPWMKHVHACRDLIRRAFEAANKIGDLTLVAYSCDYLNTNLLAAGRPLAEVHREAENGLKFAQQARFGHVVAVITAQLGFIRTLLGLTRKFGSFDDEEFDELRFERYLAGKPVLALPECLYWVRKLQGRFFAGDYRSALDASWRARQLLWTAPSTFEMAEYQFYGALSRAACCDSAFPDLHREHFEALVAHRKQLEIWAENCPENFENRVALASAEIARIEGRELDAERLYEQAILSAQANGFVHHEALANELAARFYAARGFEKIANAYLRDARYGYLRWGADGKVRQLDELYPHLREGERAVGPTSTIGAPLEHLDFGTVFKVSQAIAGEIVLEKLIDTLMRAAVEHAGAERGVLILPSDSGPRIEAEATTSGDTIVVSLKEASVTAAALPESIVHYVARTRETAILDDASGQNSFSEDTYIRRHHARSILCMPLVNQSKLIGVLYLENNLAPHVFTPPRITVLRLLASQAAISLENTRLYRELELREAKIRRLFDVNIIGIFIWNLEGKIIEANEAFLRMVGYSRADLISGRVRWTELTPAEWRDRDEQAVAEMATTRIFQPLEKEYFRKDGSRVPVMIGGASFEESNNEGVVFVLDLSKQKRAEEALQKTQTDLAHMARVTTLGELTASITHEVSQPLAGMLTNASASLRWLAGDSPNLTEAREAIRRITRDGNRASGVIARMRALFKKAPAPHEPFDINEMIQEVLAITQGELQRNRVSLRTEFEKNLPMVKGDRIQLQQVILNLVVNAVEAMSGIREGLRELCLSSQKVNDIPGEAGTVAVGGDPLTDSPGESVLVAIRDTGPGLHSSQLERVFETYYTTKSQGMGMGLAISRSIIEAHSGRLWATTTASRGAVFQFTLPLPRES